MVWPTIDRDMVHECAQRKVREWWKGHMHIAVMSNLAHLKWNFKPHIVQRFELE